MSVCKGGQSERREVEQRFYLFFLLADVFIFFEHRRNSHVILFHTHTQHQVNLVIGMRDIRKILKLLIGIRDIPVSKRFWELI